MPSSPDFLDEAHTTFFYAVQWGEENSVRLAVGVASIVVLFLVLRLAASKAHHLLGAQSCADPNSWQAILNRLAGQTSNVFLFLLTVRFVARFFDLPTAVMGVVSFLFTVAAVMQGAAWVRELVLGIISRRAAEDSSDSSTLASAMGVISLIVNIAVWAVAAIVILDNLGVNVTALVAGLGVGGIAIGLAAQGIFSDLFAALSILFDKPFSRGDTITFGTTTGTVEHIGLKTTRLRALSGEQIVVSNTNLLNQQVHNMRRIDERRVVMLLSLIYQTSPETMRHLPELLKELVNARQLCRFERAYFSGFAASSIDFELAFHVMAADFETMAKERHAVALAIVERFAADGIEFAYPSQVSFIAGPDGKLVAPVADHAPVGGRMVHLSQDETPQ